MIDALISGKLIKDPSTRTGPSGKPFASFLLRVSTGDSEPIVVSGIAFGEVSERIARLQKGDPLTVIGSLKPTSWTDRASNETRHGLSIVANNSLSPYDIQKKRKPKPDSPAGNSANGDPAHPFDDDLSF